MKMAFGLQRVLPKLRARLGIYATTFFQLAHINVQPAYRSEASQACMVFVLHIALQRPARTALRHSNAKSPQESPRVAFPSK